MGYTVEEFNFLGKSKNVLFVRDECLADGTAHAFDTVNSLSLEIVNLKNSVDEIKEAVCNGSQEKVTQELQELKSVVQEVKQTTAVTSEAKLHFPIPKSKTDYNFELRFSGIPEFISSTKSANRKDVFEHDEKLLKESLKFLASMVTKFLHFDASDNSNLKTLVPDSYLLSFHKNILWTKFYRVLQC